MSIIEHAKTSRLRPESNERSSVKNLLNNDEAKEALKSGLKLTHSYFTSSEWVKGVGCVYVFEDGARCSPREFWSIREDFPAEWRII